ncbi:MAG: hypothetical protein QMC89_01010 [Candidatus Hodarchaeaceae archaeon]|nr:hypothetical protein [Candidatus Hodarchaeaceae archaeon]
MESDERVFDEIFGDSSRARVVGLLLSKGRSHGKSDILAATEISPRDLEACLQKLMALGIIIEENRKFRINTKSKVGRALHVFHQELLLAEAEAFGHHGV